MIGEHPNLDRFQGITYGRSPAMIMLPSIMYLNQRKRAYLYRIWWRAVEKAAYAELADW